MRACPRARAVSLNVAARREDLAAAPGLLQRSDGATRRVCCLEAVVRGRRSGYRGSVEALPRALAMLGSVPPNKGEPMTTVLCHCRVADYDVWRRGYDHALKVTPGVRSFHAWRAQDVGASS